MDKEQLPIGTRVKHEQYGEGIIHQVNLTSYGMIFVRGGETSFSKNSDKYEVLEEVEREESTAEGLDLNLLSELVNHIMDERGAVIPQVEMADKWIGGEIVLEPGREGVQGKSLPIDTFFNKVIMVRDRLRVLEQNINSHKSLSNEEKVHLQQYITKAYGSLTTFNVLFSDKADYFTGSSK